MTRTTLLSALLAAVASPAAANPFGELFAYTGQIRGQAAVLEAQTDATFDCPGGRLIADDVYDELRELCRDLQRLEEQISRPIQSAYQFRRLERRIRELDEQACDVQDAVHDALEDRRFRQATLANRQPVAFANPGLPPHVVNRLPPHVRARLVSSHANRGVNVRVGGGRFQLTIGGGPTTAFRPIGVAQPAPGPSPEAAALCQQAERLRTMTRQLVAIVCH